MDDLIQRAREALVDVTPGPWRASWESVDPDWAIVTGPGGGIVSNVNDAEQPNARFIAAARDLVPAMADRLEAQEALLFEAMETLRFYADEHYDGYDIHITDYGLSTENGPIIKDSGERARATLAKMRAHLEDKP